MRLVVVCALLLGCASRALPEDPSLLTGAPDLSVPEDPDLSISAPSDLGSASPDASEPGLPSCGVAGGGAGSVPTPLFDTTTVGAGAFVGSIGIGDLDGDGFLDLVTANRNDFYPPPIGDNETISVILSSGAGTFRAQTKYVEPLYPWNIALGDFNRDGLLDVVADTGGMLNVRLNLGAGALGAQTQYADNVDGAQGLAAVDVDGDGNLDLVTESFSGGPPVVHAIDVRLGRGDGTFGDRWTLPGAGGEYVKGADFNADGRGDVVFVSQESKTFGVALGQADGTLVVSGRWGVPGGALPQGLAVGDVDGDGLADIVLSNYGPGSVVVARGDGQGGFSCATSYPTVGNGGNGLAVAIADVNGDGRPDVLVGDYAGNALDFFGGVGEGALAAPVPLPNKITNPVSISVGDFDRNGTLDLAVGSSMNDLVTILLNRTP